MNLFGKHWKNSIKETKTFRISGRLFQSMPSVYAFCGFYALQVEKMRVIRYDEKKLIFASGKRRRKYGVEENLGYVF